MGILKSMQTWFGFGPVVSMPELAKRIRAEFYKTEPQTVAWYLDELERAFAELPIERLLNSFAAGRIYLVRVHAGVPILDDRKKYDWLDIEAIYEKLRDEG